MPGLVNAHCHLELTAMRGFLEDLDFRRWILRLTNARRAVLDRDALLDSARYGLEEGLRAGITSYADTCESGVVMQAMREAGVRGMMYQEVFGPDPAQCAESIAGLREKVAGLRYLETPLVRVGVSPHAPYTVSDDLFRATTRARARAAPAHGDSHRRERARAAARRRRGRRVRRGLRRRGIDVERARSSPIELLADSACSTWRRCSFTACARTTTTSLGSRRAGRRSHTMNEERLHTEHTEPVEKLNQRRSAPLHADAAPAQSVGERSLRVDHELLLQLTLGDVDRHRQTPLARDIGRCAEEIVRHRVWRSGDTPTFTRGVSR